jgi:hypothetical protein
MAERASLPPHYFPEQWADVIEEEIVVFDATSLDALIQWPAPMREDPWKQLHDPMNSSMIVTLSGL